MRRPDRRPCRCRCPAARHRLRHRHDRLGHRPGGSAKPAMPTAIPAADGPVVGLGLVLDRTASRASAWARSPSPTRPSARACRSRAGTGRSTGATSTTRAGSGSAASPSRAPSTATTLTYESAVSGALYDPMPRPRADQLRRRGPHRRPSSRRSRRSSSELPGALSTMPGDNLVVVDVVHDDGSLQDWADAAYGAGLVFVHSALAPAAGLGRTCSPAGRPARGSG